MAVSSTVGTGVVALTGTGLKTEQPDRANNITIVIIFILYPWLVSSRFCGVSRLYRAGNTRADQRAL